MSVRCDKTRALGGEETTDEIDHNPVPGLIGADNDAKVRRAAVQVDGDRRPEYLGVDREGRIVGGDDDALNGGGDVA